MPLKTFDAEECMCVAHIALQGGRIDAEDRSLDRWTEDRRGDDTLNRLFSKGAISQVQTDDDAFVIVLGP